MMHLYMLTVTVLLEKRLYLFLYPYFLFPFDLIPVAYIA